MKKLIAKIRDLFRAEEMADIDTAEVMDALGDMAVRKAWLLAILDEITRIHNVIDQKLASGEPFSIEDLSAQRRALQFVLQTAVSTKRGINRARNHNPSQPGKFDLESVTVQLAPR